jgi:hypothetical protein
LKDRRLPRQIAAEDDERPLRIYEHFQDTPRRCIYLAPTPLHEPVSIQHQNWGLTATSIEPKPLLTSAIFEDNRTDFNIAGIEQTKPSHFGARGTDNLNARRGQIENFWKIAGRTETLEL